MASVTFKTGRSSRQAPPTARESSRQIEEYRQHVGAAGSAVVSYDGSAGRRRSFVRQTMRKYRYYDILQVSRDATREDINVAFRRLAREWHPDRNPGNGEAEATFRRINTAYQVLSNEVSRGDYDRSPVECPTCGTHEVLSMSEARWQCKHCGCRFDVSGAAEPQAIDAPTAPPLKRTRFRAFQATQCSWCSHFYDGSSPCPYGSPRTSCDSFRPMPEAERKVHLSNAAMPSIADEWLRPSAERGLIKKCTYCGALNPNPQRMNEPCWNCQRPIRTECPHCGMPTLFYDIEQGSWRCANHECSGKRFGFDSSASGWTVTTQPQPPRPRPSGRPRSRISNTPSCPHCGAGLVYSDQQDMWCCVVCRNLYPPDEAGFARPQDAPIPEYAPTSRRGKRVRRPAPERTAHQPAPRPRRHSQPKREKTMSDYLLLAGAIGLIIIIGAVILLGMAGQLG
jgi:ribosomal protein L37AE/L43A